MTRILIVESNSRELLAQGKSAASFFVTTLLGLDAALELEIVAPYAGGVLLPETADGVVFTGSGVDWATDAAEAAPLRAAMEASFGAGRPVWGSCNGLQLAAVVLGGQVGTSVKGREDGLALNIRPSVSGLRHPLLAGRVPGYSAPCVHRDEVSVVPAGAEVLAGNRHSAVQVLSYERDDVCFWGTQYHPEMRFADVASVCPSKVEGDEPTFEARTLELRNWLSHVRASGGR